MRKRSAYCQRVCREGSSSVQRPQAQQPRLRRLRASVPKGLCPDRGCAARGLRPRTAQGSLTPLTFAKTILPLFCQSRRGRIKKKA